MKDEREFEALLSTALRRRGAPAPFEVDVADRVMARVATLGAPRRSDLSARQLGRWAAAAAIVGAALIAVAVSQGAGLASANAELLRWISDASGALAKLAVPATALAGTVGRVAMALVSLARTIVQPLEPFQPLAQAALAAVAAAMLSITTFIVGRDVSGRVTHKERA
jgi:hypothetical protein